MRFFFKTWHAFNYLILENNNSEECISSFYTKSQEMTWWWYHNENVLFCISQFKIHRKVINNIEKSPLLGQGQHLFTLLKDH